MVFKRAGRRVHNTRSASEWWTVWRSANIIYINEGPWTRHVYGVDACLTVTTRQPASDNPLPTYQSFLYSVLFYAWSINKEGNNNNEIVYQVSNKVFPTLFTCMKIDLYNDGMGMVYFKRRCFNLVFIIKMLHNDKVLNWLLKLT